jgi:hypothetical protein
MSKILKFITNFGCSSPTNDDDEIMEARNQPLSPRTNSLTTEQSNRFEKYLGRKPNDSMKDIPMDIIGLGYAWYPILIESKRIEDLTSFVQTMIVKIRPSVDVSVDVNSCPEISYDEDQVISEIVNNAVYIGRRPMGNHLGSSPRFFDPQEVIDAISKLKQRPNTFFVGLMQRTDQIDLSINGQSFLLGQLNCKNYCKVITKDEKWKIKCGIYPRYDNETRIFNWLFKINVKGVKRVKEVESL